MMAFLRLQWPLMLRRLPHKGSEFNAKSSLSTTRRARKYETADGLEFRLCRVRVSGRLFKSHSTTIATGGRLDDDPHGHASAQRRIMEADILVVHEPVSRAACG
jgi:hypothetical protein